MNRIASIHNSPPSGGTPIAGGGLLTPIQNGVRRTSGTYRASSPTNADATPLPNGQQQNTPASPGTNGEWSSAIGHATTSGKSGRVIERLQSEVDRLKRELKEQQTKADDLQQRVQMCQPRIQALETENGNMTHARDVDQTLLARRDRQVADLKEDLDKEKKRRQALEGRTRELQMERDEAVEGKKREIQSLGEETRHATNSAELTAKSFQQFRQQAQLQIAGARKEIEELAATRRQDRDRLAKMDVVYEQMRQELERNKKINHDLVVAWESMREAYRRSTAAMHKETITETEKARKLSAEMDQVVNEMRWVMNIKRNTELHKTQPR